MSRLFKHLVAAAIKKVQPVRVVSRALSRTRAIPVETIPRDQLGALHRHSHDSERRRLEPVASRLASCEIQTYRRSCPMLARYSSSRRGAHVAALPIFLTDPFNLEHGQPDLGP